MTQFISAVASFVFLGIGVFGVLVVMGATKANRTRSSREGE